MESGDKVVCVDATPFPNYAPRDCELSDFVFPGGYIEEGTIYCVESVFEQSGEYGVTLVGKKIFYQGEEIGWLHSRFRKVEEQKTFVSSEKSEDAPQT